MASRAGWPEHPPFSSTARPSSKHSPSRKSRRASIRRLPRPSSIVTGASRGIGRAIAIELAKTHDVIGTYRGRRDAAESLQAETGAAILQCDISSRQDREALLSFARDRFEHLDLLV